MPAPRSLLHVPDPALAGCIVAAIERDTRGCALSDAARCNFYPASPLVMLTWVFHGSLHLLTGDGEREPFQPGPALPAITLTGPQRRPLVSWSPGDIHAFSVGLYPEVLAHWLGEPLDGYMDRTVALDEMPLPALQSACTAVQACGGAAPFDVLQQVFTGLYREEGGAAAPVPLLGDWLRSMATRAAHSGSGRGLRQLQRRIRDWTGQSQRDLALFERVEAAFHLREALADQGEGGLAAVAAEAGFADQSHMGRAVRRVTGLSPARFSERLATDEAFWYYRLVADFRRPAR
ncbi:helix-turn-helix domain-containing protein [Chitinilyticum piscinae]|uniref:Helix-turn-helix domain-containing protein n=1 Tax=Chitinilyticum piscinae TaxID=2866724 RepID=A0A8J7K843_9NEIS|nr:helix-turn-helix domain-containing protein [Chitinilyticum piscinae]MBE9608998.1 helix-turn-helix domain-containing protein [Chitinilyticum piscinae]